MLLSFAILTASNCNSASAQTIYNEGGERIDQITEGTHRSFVITLDLPKLMEDLAAIEQRSGSDNALSWQKYLLAHPMNYAMGVGDRLIKDNIKESITYLSHDVTLQEFFTVRNGAGAYETHLVSTLDCGWECGLRIYMMKGKLTPWFIQNWKEEYSLPK
jgi:hypothetical protein